MIDLKNSVKTAVGGLCAALSIVLMFLGGISSVFVYAVPMLLGTLMCMLKKLSVPAVQSAFISPFRYSLLCLLPIRNVF